MNNALRVLGGVILGVVIMLLFQSCPKQESSNVKIEKIIIHDTIQGDSIVFYRYLGQVKPDKEWIDEETDSLPMDNECIEAWLKLQESYNKWLVYSDTLQNDSSMLLGVIDTIHQNKIWGRSYFSQNRRPIAINTTINTTTINNADGIYAGGGFIGNSFGGEVSIIKKKLQFDIGTYQKEIKVSIKYRIWKL